MKKFYTFLFVDCLYVTLRQEYSPWQRGTNENTNGLLRECVPKSADISVIPDDVIQRFVDSLNRRPRKCLGWLSPYEIFFDSLLHLT